MNRSEFEKQVTAVVRSVNESFKRTANETDAELFLVIY